MSERVLPLGGAGQGLIVSRKPATARRHANPYEAAANLIATERKPTPRYEVPASLIPRPARLVGHPASPMSRRRRDLGLSLAALGKLVGANQMAVRHWESGRSRPRITSVGKLAKALNVPVAEVVGWFVPAEEPVAAD